MTKKVTKGKLAAEESQKKIEVLGERWLKAKAAKEAADAELKEVGAEIKTYAEANREKLFVHFNSVKVAGLKLAIVNETKLIVPIDLDTENFYRRFPNACKLDIQKGVIKTLSLDVAANQALKSFGVEITSEDKFTIEKG